MDDPTFVIEHPDDPYKATITWGAEGVKITVEATSLSGLPGLETAEIKAECDRRAKLIVEHFKQIIPRTY